MTLEGLHAIAEYHGKLGRSFLEASKTIGAPLAEEMGNRGAQHVAWEFELHETAEELKAAVDALDTAATTIKAGEQCRREILAEKALLEAELASSRKAGA